MSCFTVFCAVLCINLWCVGCERDFLYLSKATSDGSAHVSLTRICSTDDLPDDWIVWASQNVTTNATGWTQLEIHTNPDVPDSDQAYYAGYVEGYLTHPLIHNHYNNLMADYCINETEYCTRVTAYLEANLNFVTKQVRLLRNTDSYWHQVGLVLEQLTGLEDGYSLGCSKERVFVTNGSRIEEAHILSQPGSLLWLNLVTELFDLSYTFNRTSILNAEEDGYCSALVKLMPDINDLYVGHNSWITYDFMLRSLKKYDFHYHLTGSSDSKLVPSCAISFSSYPGIIFSIDDYYILSSGLIVTETSIQNSNPDLFPEVDKPDKVVMEFVRTLVSNRLATNGKEWTETFSLFNSGTYNNQFMVVDYNRFSQWLHHKSDCEGEGILWIVEQMPGITQKADVTDVLLRQMYWASYNRPYFPNIFNISGAQKMVDKYGDYYTYDKAPRALIFKRDHSKVTDLPSMYQLMRYNDFKHDHISRCNCTPPYTGIAAIAARNDLNDPNGTYELPTYKFRGSGAIDAKISNLGLMLKLEMVAVSGPTYEQQPVFNWTSAAASLSSLRHEGHPDQFDFKPVHFRWYPHVSNNVF